MKTGALLLSATTILALAACAPPGVRHSHWGGGDWGSGPLRAISKLDCPGDIDGLKLKTAAPDGKSCAYTGEEGAEVELTLTPVVGTPNATLDPIEAQLKTLLPPPSDRPRKTSKDADASDHDNVNIDLPGIAVHAAGQQANIHVGPLHIDADGDNNNVHITQGGEAGPGKSQFTIDANDDGAIIRTIGRGPDVRTSVILTSKSAGPQGWRMVGYEARGPQAGPLVVATVKSASDDHDRDPTFNDVKRLLHRNVGG